MEQGKHLSKDSQQSALIHTAFAQKNGLKLGDRIQLQQGDRQVTLTISGIFSGKTDKPGPLLSDQAENPNTLTKALWIWLISSRSPP